jgi:hypothetical protein
MVRKKAPAKKKAPVKKTSRRAPAKKESTAGGPRVDLASMTPLVVYEAEAFAKIDHWVQSSNFEVSGFGNVVAEKADNGRTIFRVTDAYLLKQENTPAHTEIDADAMSDLLFEHHKSGVVGEPNLWWHSHVKMAVFWSGEDLTTIRQIGGNGWVLATVFNQKGEMRSALQASEPFMAFTDELDTEIEVIDPFADVRAAWSRDYKAKITNKKFVFPAQRKRTGAARGQDLAFEFGTRDWYIDRVTKDDPDWDGQLVENLRKLGYPESEIDDIVDSVDDEPSEDFATVQAALWRRK